MKFVCYSEWGQLPASADTLFEQAERDSLFFSRPWFENVSATGIDDAALVLACVIDGHAVKAILPLVHSGGTTWHSLRHRYTPHYSAVLARDNQQAVLACLVQGLRKLPVEALLLEPVAASDPVLACLQRSMEAAGFRCDHMFRHYNWILRLQGQSYREYMAARPARLRNTVSRKKRKLEREHGCQIRLFSGDDVPPAMHDYHAVYQRSWKASEQYRDFLDGIVASFSHAGWSRLGILYINGRPAAAQLWFVAHGKANIFRLAYDEAWNQYSPGSILTGFMMEQVIDHDRVREIDFLTGNDAYKQDWMSDRRERFALSCVREQRPAASSARWIESLWHALKRMTTMTG